LHGETALFVAPLVVIVGWCANLPMNLQFEYFMAFALLLAVLVVGNFVRDGKTNWLEGLLLILTYFIIAVCAWYSPTLKAEDDGISGSAFTGSEESSTAHGEGTATEGSTTTGTGTREEVVATATLEAAKMAKRMIFG